MIKVDVTWLTPKEGGRKEIPRGITYLGVASFENSDLFSVCLRGKSEIIFLSPELVAPYLRVGATFKLTEGQRVVANCIITALPLPT